MNDDHYVAYVAAQPGTERAWRCKRCPGVWKWWANISGPCAVLTEPCCDYRDHGDACACPDHEWSALHPFSTP